MKKEGTITLKMFREAAITLDMQLVYGMVPRNASFDDIIERIAKESAIKIVLLTTSVLNKLLRNLIRIFLIFLYHG